MITLNKKQFAANDSEFTESLFTSGGTCVGFYKINRKSITLYNMRREKIGVINRHGVLACATKTESGYWYNSATIAEIGEYSSYSESVTEPAALIRKHCGIVGATAERNYYQKQAITRTN